MTTSRTNARGFTLIEVLLVLAIIGVMVTVMLPQVMGTMRQHRLRGATRTVISAGRHAMSLAVVAQREMEVVFDLNKHTLTVRAAEPLRTGEPGAGQTRDPVPDPVAALTDAPASTNKREAAVEAIVDEAVVHSLDGIVLLAIEIEGADGLMLFEDGARAVRYFRNGRCTPYTVTFADEDGTTVKVEVDPLSAAIVETL